MIRNRALTRIITLSVVNKAKHEPPAHSLGTGLSAEMRSAKFLITGTRQEYSANDANTEEKEKNEKGKKEMNKRINVTSAQICLMWQTIQFHMNHNRFVPNDLKMSSFSLMRKHADDC